MSRKSTQQVIDAPTRQSEQEPNWTFERRCSPRCPVRGQITLYRKGDRPEAYRHPILPIEVIDISASGLAAFCESEIAVDEPVVVFITSDGMDPHFEQRGKIVRCVPVANGQIIHHYRIAIQFDPRSAA
jgi:hypothetical protein